MAPDLFDWTPPPGYPDAPGFKEATTSRDAAEKITPVAHILRDQALQILRTAWPAGMTADEVATRMGKSVLSIRPRITELSKKGAIDKCYEKGVALRRENSSGMSALVWVAKRSYGTWT